MGPITGSSLTQSRSGPESGGRHTLLDQSFHANAGSDQVHVAERKQNTRNGVEITAVIAQLLCELIPKTGAYLFAAKSGRPLQQRNVLRASQYRQESRSSCFPPISDGDIASSGCAGGLNNTLARTLETIHY